MDEYLRKAARLIKKGEFDQAANLYEIAGELEEAAKLYLRGGSFLQAARLYERLKFFQKAAELYTKSGNFLKAADLYKECEIFIKSAEMFERAEKYFNAAEMFKRGHKYQQAAEAYEKAKQLESAGDMYQLSGKILKAAERFKEGYLQLRQQKEEEVLLSTRETSMKRLALKAAEAYHQIEHFKEAAYFFEIGKNHQRAAELYETLKIFDRAIENFFHAENFHRGLQLIAVHPGKTANLTTYASMLSHAGLLREAAQLYEKADRHEDAGYQYLAAGDLEMAAEAFTRGEIYPMAGKCYLESEQYGKAGLMFTQARRYRDAAEAYIREGNSSAAIEQYIFDQDYLSAADLSLKTGDETGAINILRMVEETSPDFIEASFRLGRISFERNDYDMALQHLQVLTNENQLNPHQTESFYYIGRIWEERHELEKADRCYRHVLDIDGSYRDTSQRLKVITDYEQKRGDSITGTFVVDITENEHPQPVMERLGEPDSEEINSFIRRRYKIEQLIGEGVLGRVYRARDTLIGRIVALKEINKSYFLKPVSLTRLKLKIMTAARLTHSNIVTIYDMGEDEDTFLIAREYIDGMNLVEFLRQGRIAPHKAISILSQCLWALDFAHKNNVYHRNLSPENILISRDHIVKLSDFGLYFKPEELTPTRGAILKKRERFLSLNTRLGKPEQPRDDLLSIAQLLVYMLIGSIDAPAEQQHENKTWRDSIMIAPRLQKILERCYSQTESNWIGSATLFAEALKTDSLEPGSLFDGRYEIIAEMGKGGMGSVFKAHDRVLRELVAIKTLRNSSLLDERNLQRFMWEIKAARKISHPNVVRIHHLGYCDGTYYISMELIYGITLKEQINSGLGLRLEEKMDILLQIIDALATVHSLDIIHRDVKPQNILLDKDLRVKLVDFGIARVGDVKGLTETGEVMGTPEYMAPEQVKKKIDHRSDIYSLGVVMFEFLTGVLPFSGDSPIAILMSHLRKPPPPPRSIVFDMDVDLENIILKCLKKTPAARYQNMQELANDLLAFRKKLKTNLSVKQ